MYTMGNSDIRDLASIESIKQNEISGYFVAVDASNWLYKYMTTTTRFTNTDDYTDNDGNELPNLIGVPRGIRKFIKNNINPVFVFDGKPNDLKAEEIERRRKIRQEAEEKAKESNNKIEKSKYKSRSQRLNPEIIETTKTILDYLDIPYMTAPQAAESQTAVMSQSNLFDAALTEDYDSLIFKAQTTVRKFTTSSNDIELMSFEDTVSKHDISHDQLILATILCGTDYNDGVKGIGPKTSLKKVNEHPTIEKLRDELDEPLEDAEEIIELYKNPEVSTEWPEPKIPKPNVSKVKNFLDDKGIDKSHVDKSLREIEENSSQTGLNSF